MVAATAPVRREGVPGFFLRAAAMLYEAALLFGLCFAVSALVRITYPEIDAHLVLLQAALFFAIGAYFVYCWTRSGQTLAMKAWRLRLVGSDGLKLSIGKAVARYLLAWHLFAPAIALLTIVHLPIALALALLPASVLIMLSLIYLDSRRQLWHDRVLHSRVVLEPAGARA